MSKYSNIRSLGLFLALLGMMGTIVSAIDSSASLTKGSLTIYATCDGIDFAKLSVKDGVAAANVLKTSFNKLSSKVGQEEIHKLVFSGPWYNATTLLRSAIPSTKIGKFIGNWVDETEWLAPSLTVRDDDIDEATGPSGPSARVQAWLDALLATWEKSFVKGLFETGRPGFIRVQRCSLKYEKSLK